MRNGFYSAKNYPEHLRRIRFKDPESGKTLVFLTNNTALPALTIAALYKSRWQIGVSSQGHINQPVRVRPRLTDSSLVAWEASRSESETMKPSDNMLGNASRAFSEVRDYMEMKVRNFLTRRKRRSKTSTGWWRWSNKYLCDVLGLYWDWKVQSLPGVERMR